MHQAHLEITGIVQGVNFRFTAREKAKTLGLAGFAKNLPDGSVEILVQGDEAAINSFISWCHHGPPAAKVEKVHLDWENTTTTFPDFAIF